MNVLGISGGPHISGEDPIHFPYLDGYWHDAAAVLILDESTDTEQQRFGYEEERLTRLKHTAHFPTNAVRACLDDAGLHLEDLDAIAVNFTEEYWLRFFEERMIYDSSVVLGSPRSLIVKLLNAIGRGQVNPSQLHFIEHHHAHAMTAWIDSGFNDALVVTIDGAGDTGAGMVASADLNRFEQLWRIPKKHSLGGLYLWMTRFLGFQQFDEYKVMGLAALGDPNVLRDKLSLIRLLPRGSHEVDWSFVFRLRELIQPRRRGDEIIAIHANIAATLQEALEEVVLHILRNARTYTSQTRLCMAGGVAHNCSLAGTIAATEQFDEIFVHPASHDAGCALGAALAVISSMQQYSSIQKSTSRKRLRSVYWGTNVDVGMLRHAEKEWNEWISVEDRSDLPTWAAEILEGGEILPWIRGRAEFGPRALGHRSILADPRYAETRDQINGLIKRREAFRPFAPVVQAERVHDIFEVPPGIDCSFMSYAVKVRADWVDRLKAVVHSNRTARLQTVTRIQDPALWDLLEAFNTRTGVPVLLNTSLNVAGEPIIDTVNDLIVFMLTTSLHKAVVAGYVLELTSTDPEQLAPCVPTDANISNCTGTDGQRRWSLERGGPERHGEKLSEAVARILLAADGTLSISDLIKKFTDRHYCVEALRHREDILELWRKRLITMSPPRNRLLLNVS